MEFILINENKIKVMLTEQDLKDFEIDAEDLDYSNTDTKRMFWDILSRAKHSTGFDTDGQKVLVQLYPSRHGGCELFVTKIGELCPADDGCMLSSKPGEPHTEKRASKLRLKTQIEKKDSSVFLFESLSDLLCVCRHLESLGYDSQSSAYIDRDKRYYLFLEGIDTSGYIPLDIYSFICEFGILENVKSSLCYLGEYGQSIAKDNAVSLLSRC